MAVVAFSAPGEDAPVGEGVVALHATGEDAPVGAGVVALYAAGEDAAVGAGVAPLCSGMHVVCCMSQDIGVSGITGREGLVRGPGAADKGMVPEGSGMAHLLTLPLQLLASGEMKL